MNHLTFESLPVELIADILGELDLQSLTIASYLSKRLHKISSDCSLNPWRRPILRNLRSQVYEAPLKNLSVRSTVPRHNWIDILSLATPTFILYEATLPNLRSAEWEESFNRRFLPGWRKWRKDGSWKEAYFKMLYRVSHRSITSCTAEEAWTKYIVLNRNGTANELEISSRSFNPLVLFNQMKLQNNLAHIETRIRLVVQFADVRILAFGTLNRPRSNLTVNANAHVFLHPPGVTDDISRPFEDRTMSKLDNVVEDHGIYPGQEAFLPQYPFCSSPILYTRLTRPIPATTHANYPFYTPGGGDKRWLIKEEEEEEEGLLWVGPLMLIAQITGRNTRESSGDWRPLQDLDLVVGPGRQQYASFTWVDLLTIAPWMDDRIKKKIQGPGLGI